MEQLIAMGFPQESCKVALEAAGGNVDMAISILLDGGMSTIPSIVVPREKKETRVRSDRKEKTKGEDADGDSEMRSDEGSYEYESDEEEELKLVLCVRDDLNMGVGKIAAQCVHAAFLIERVCMDDRFFDNVFAEWQLNGEKTVVVRIRDFAHMQALAKACTERSDVKHAIIHDAGRTQIQEGSATVLGVFGLSSKVDTITGQLKLR